MSRLPQLSSPNLLVDGDEALVGLMAKHLVEGREFPLFFWGQHYGLSTVEVAAIAVAFLVAGTGALPLKLAMLAVWTAGVVFLFLALATVLKHTSAFWTTAVFVLNPAWAATSMNAWSGYLTAFAMSAALLWLMLQERARDAVVGWIAAGVLVGVIYLAQPLWLPGLLPVVAAALIARRRFSPALICIAVALPLILLVRFAGSSSTETWTGPGLINSDLIGSVPAVAGQIYTSLTGAYYLRWALEPPGPATVMVATVWCGLLALALPLQLYRLLTGRWRMETHVLFLSVAATLGASWVGLDMRDPRYILPLTGFLTLLAGAELVDLVQRQLLPRKLLVGATAAMLVAGAAAMVEYRQFSFLWTNPPERLSETNRLHRVINYLQVSGVRHVFSMNGLLDPQIIFYSDEQLLARWTWPVTRNPAYAEAVNLALARGEKVAVVGYAHTSGAPGCSDVPICTGGLERMVPNPEAIYTIDGKYFAYVGADRDLLTRLGFRFWE